MILFLDTEFIAAALESELLSLALVSEDGSGEVLRRTQRCARRALPAVCAGLGVAADWVAPRHGM